MFCRHVVASIFLSTLRSKCGNYSGLTIWHTWNKKSHKCRHRTLFTGRTVMYLPKLPSVLLAIRTCTYNNSGLLKGLLSAQYYDDITYSTCSAITRHPNTAKRQQKLLQINLKFKSQLCWFNVHGSVYRKNILIHVQQDATLHSLFYLETALHVSGGITTHHQERKQLYLQHLVFVTPLLLPAAIAEEFELTV
jgi:hypothetical protein